MTDDLVAFLRARLDEDERVSRAAATRERGGASWVLVDDQESEVQAGSGLRVVPRTPPVLARHIARHDPARVLREVEAKRRIVDKYAYWAALEESGGLSNHMRGERIAWLYTCLNLAPVYADHPDYREDWRP